MLTHGADGALMVTAEERLLARPPLVAVTSAIGAGDSFVAGLCLALAEERPHADVLRLAVAAAAAAMLTPGTEFCRPADVDRLFLETGPAVAV